MEERGEDIPPLQVAGWPDSLDPQGLGGNAAKRVVTIWQWCRKLYILEDVCGVEPQIAEERLVSRNRTRSGYAVENVFGNNSGDAAPEVPSSAGDPSKSLPDRLKSLSLQQVSSERRHTWTGKGGFVVIFLLLCGGYLYADGYNRFVEPLISAGDVSHLSGQIKVVPVSVATNADTILFQASGYIIAKKQIHLSPEIAGRIVELPIEEGVQVQQGDLLARVASDHYEADFKQAKAGLAIAEARLAELKAGPLTQEIDQARATLAVAAAELERAKDEFARFEALKDSVAPAVYQQKKATRQQAEARVQEASAALQVLEAGTRSEQIAAAEAEVDQAQALVDEMQYLCDSSRILAPYRGTILSKAVELGEVWRPELLVASLCTMADLTQLQAEVEVSERNLAMVRMAQPCRITPDEAFPGRIYQGRVAWRSPAVKRERASVQVRIDIVEPDDYLLPNLTCNVLFLSEGDSDAPVTLQIPQRAVIERDGSTFVFTLDKRRKAQRRLVVLGEVLDDDMIAVLDGLEEGELVLVADGKGLAQGQLVPVK